MNFGWIQDCCLATKFAATIKVQHLEESSPSGRQHHSQTHKQFHHLPAVSRACEDSRAERPWRVGIEYTKTNKGTSAYFEVSG